jgi:hypothetical protein
MINDIKNIGICLLSSAFIPVGPNRVVSRMSYKEPLYYGSQINNLHNSN